MRIICSSAKKKYDASLEWLVSDSENDCKFIDAIPERENELREYISFLYRTYLNRVTFRERSHEELMETNPHYRKTFQDNFRNLTGRPHSSEIYDMKIKAQVDEEMSALQEAIDRKK